MNCRCLWIASHRNDSPTAVQSRDEINAELGADLDAERYPG